MPPSDSDWAIELDVNGNILHSDGTFSTVIYNNGTAADRFGLISKEGRVILLNGTSSGALNGILNEELTKVLVTFTSSSGEWKLYIGGTLAYSSTLGGYSNQTNTLKTSQYSSHIPDTTIQKLKVHADITKALENYLAQYE